MTTKARIAELLDEGLSLVAIAQRLGLAYNTVRYHRDRIANQGDQPAREPAPPGVVSQVRTRDAVAALLANGTSRSDIARRLGISKATVSYHARRLGAPVDERGARRYDWQAIQQ